MDHDEAIQDPLRTRVGRPARGGVPAADFPAGAAQPRRPKRAGSAAGSAVAAAAERPYPFAAPRTESPLPRGSCAALGRAQPRWNRRRLQRKWSVNLPPKGRGSRQRLPCGDRRDGIGGDRESGLHGVWQAEEAGVVTLYHRGRTCWNGAPRGLRHANCIKDECYFSSGCGRAIWGAARRAPLEVPRPMTRCVRAARRDFSEGLDPDEATVQKLASGTWRPRRCEL